MSVIDPNTNDVVENIAVGISPTAIDASGKNVYVTNSDSNTVSVIDLTTNNVIKNITTVGDNPTAIRASDDVYIANSGSTTVSVIDPNTNDVIENITVRSNPRFFGYFLDRFDAGGLLSVLYVINSDDTISVIDPDTNDVIKNITTVGNTPMSIAAGDDAMDVANSDSDTVSVINATSNTVIKNINVGDSPNFIAASGDAVYVANSGSDTVSVINSLTNDVVAGVTFDTNPFRGGQINCNGLDAPINRYFYISSGTECVAKPNNGYEFDSWGQIFEGNSTRTVSAPASPDSLLDTLRDTFSDDPAAILTRNVSAPASSDSPLALVALRDAFTDDPAATLTVNRFGNFTAYFTKLPPPVSAEFMASIITVIIAAFVGSLLIPAAVGWFKSKKQTSRLNSFHLVMGSINKDGLNEKDIGDLNKLNQNVSDSYSAGKITSEQYTNLKNEVSAAYQKIFKKRIESITNPSTEDVNKIKNEIEDAYSDRKITELDYNLLNGKISRILDTN